MTKIGIITGSNRDERVNLQVADYILDLAKAHRKDVEFEIVDIVDYDLSWINSPAPGMLNRQYDDPKVRAWSEKIDSLDGYIFVTAEYNRNATPALLNAIDVIFPEWNNKAAGIAGYGSTGGVAATQVLRLTLANVGLAVVGQAADFNLFTEFEDGQFKPFNYHAETVQTVIDSVIAWTDALAVLR